MGAHRIFKKWAQPFRRGRRNPSVCVSRAAGACPWIPPRPRARRAPPFRNVQQHAMPGRKRKHAFDHAYRFRYAAKQQIRRQRILRNLPRHASAGQQSTHLGRKRKALRRLRVIERLDAQRISRQKQQRRRCISPRKSSNANANMPRNSVEALLAPFLPGMYQNFRVGLRAKRCPARRNCSRSSL